MTQPLPEGTAPHGRPTVLLVDDEPSVLSLVGLLLRANGYSVLTAASGERARALSEQTAGPIELLVTDWNLPDVTGPELAAALAPARAGMKVLYISGGDEQPPASAAAAAFLQKPFVGRELLDRVRALLGG